MHVQAYGGCTLDVHEEGTRNVGVEDMRDVHGMCMGQADVTHIWGTPRPPRSKPPENGKKITIHMRWGLDKTRLCTKPKCGV